MLLELLRGLQKFQEVKFHKLEELFYELAQGQSPDTLVGACIDSRVVPSLITQAKPGSFFTVRSVGNIIFPYPPPPFNETAVAINFAVSKGVANIIICGHSDCGAMKALQNFDHEKPGDEFLHPYIKHIKENMPNYEEHKHDLCSLTKEHLKQQIKNLKGYPTIQNHPDIKIQGWYYDVATGTVEIYDEELDKFIASKEMMYRSLQKRAFKAIDIAFANHFQNYQSQKDISIAWPQIKQDIADALWEDIGFLYETPECSNFQDIIESYASNYQEAITNSSWYKGYCNDLIANSLFSPPLSPGLQTIASLCT